MVVEWFALLADLVFLRINFSHFHSGSLPGWSDCDAVMAERMETMVAFAASEGHCAAVADAVSKA